MLNRLPLIFTLLALGTLASGFTVKRNVNATTPPQEVVVLFDKDAGHEHLELLPNGENCTMDYNVDGAIEIHMTSNTETKPEIRWSGTEVPETLNLHEYQYVIMRCQWSGDQTRTFANGNIRAEEPDNPWFTTTLLDVKGVRTAGLNLAVITGEAKMPREMVTMKIPMALYLQGAFNDPTKINAVAFLFGGTHNYYERNYTFTIERIALAN